MPRIQGSMEVCCSFSSVQDPVSWQACGAQRSCSGKSKPRKKQHRTLGLPSIPRSWTLQTDTGFAGKAAPHLHPTACQAAAPQPHPGLLEELVAAHCLDEARIGVAQPGRSPRQGQGRQLLLATCVGRLQSRERAGRKGAVRPFKGGNSLPFMTLFDALDMVLYMFYAFAVVSMSCL